MGFLALPQDATFAQAREQVEEDLDVDEGGNWQFLIDTLGPVSRKQERKLGPLREWVDDTQQGTRKNPIKLVILEK